MKPKEYLLKHGHIDSIGRGRLSREHIAIIEKAVAEGVNIEGYSVSSKPTAETPKVAREPRADTIPDVPDESRPEKNWQAYRKSGVDIVDVGMRTVCNNCGSSLTYCRCPKPVVWVDADIEAVVYFKPRTSPLPTKRW